MSVICFILFIIYFFKWKSEEEYIPVLYFSRYYRAHYGFWCLFWLFWTIVLL